MEQDRDRTCQERIKFLKYGGDLAWTRTVGQSFIIVIRDASWIYMTAVGQTTILFEIIFFIVENKYLFLIYYTQMWDVLLVVMHTVFTLFAVHRLNARTTNPGH